MWQKLTSDKAKRCPRRKAAHARGQSCAWISVFAWWWFLHVHLKITASCRLVKKTHTNKWFLCLSSLLYEKQIIRSYSCSWRITRHWCLHLHTVLVTINPPQNNQHFTQSEDGCHFLTSAWISICCQGQRINTYKHPLECCNVGPAYWQLEEECLFLRWWLQTVTTVKTNRTLLHHESQTFCKV